MPTHKHAQGKQRLLRIEQDLLSKNNLYADQNRDLFNKNKILAINLVSSSGSGKTSLLVETIKVLKSHLQIMVIEGEHLSRLDSEKVEAAGASAISIQSENAGHIDAHVINHALSGKNLPERSLLVIENVGDQTCPACFDLGEAYKVVMVSVTEGDDKPLRYVHMFKSSDLMIINKIDLLPYVDFDLQRCVDNARQVNPGIQVMQLSVTKETNFQSWISWIHDHIKT